MQFRVIHEPWKMEPYVLQGKLEAGEMQQGAISSWQDWQTLKSFTAENEALAVFAKCATTAHVIAQSPPKTVARVA